MRRSALLFASLAALMSAAACGSHQSGGMTGPSMNNRVPPEEGTPIEDAPPEIQSNDILARDQVTRQALVRHILIGWKDLAEAYRGEMDPRAAERTRAQADALAAQLLGRVRAGEPMEGLMAEYSEDPGSAKTGETYEVTPESTLVFEFRRLSLRLNVGEAGLVQTTYGWHIILRVE